MAKVFMARKLLWFGLFLAIVSFSTFTHAQQDFADELEAELEAEIGLDDESDDGSADDFEDLDEEVSRSEDSGTENSEGDEEDFADEDFSEEASGEEIADEDFSDEDFGDEGDVAEDDFADFAEEPEEDNVDVAPIVEDPVAEPVAEEPASEEVLDDQPADEPMQFADPVEEEPAQEPMEFADSEESMQAASPTPTEPNLDYEARLFDIYQNYHSNPTPNAQWEAALGSRKAEIYSISRGDTLWGISELFFGDGGYWPKVWSINSKIENPHLIKTGNRIQFVMGTESEAPMFTVSEPEAKEKGASQPEGETVAQDQELSQEDVAKLIDSGALSAEDTSQLQEIIESDLEDAEKTVAEKAAENPENKLPQEEDLEPEIDIPPPGIVSKPVLRSLPPSVPEWQSADPDDRYDDLGIDYGVRKITLLKDTKFLLSYIDDTEKNSEAQVIETESGGYFGSDADYIYVKFPVGKGQPGEQYLVVQSGGRILAPTSPVETSDLGYQKKVNGLVTLLNKVRADVSDRYQVFRAQVDKSVNPLELGSELVRGSLPIVNLSDQGPRSNIVAQIIGGTGGKTRTVFGKESLVYINRGRKEGVRAGQIIDVRAHKENRYRETQILEHNQVIGKIKIVKVADRFATAIVLESSAPIISGDLTGRGPYQYRRSGEIMTASAGGGFGSAEYEESDSDGEMDFSEDAGDSDSELEDLLDEEDEFGEDSDL